MVRNRYEETTRERRRFRRLRDSTPEQGDLKGTFFTPQPPLPEPESLQPETQNPHILRPPCARALGGADNKVRRLHLPPCTPVYRILYPTKLTKSPCTPPFTRVHLGQVVDQAGDTLKSEQARTFVIRLNILASFA